MYSRMVVDHFDGSYWLIIESCCVSDIVLHLHQSTTNKLCSRNFCEKNMMWHISSRPTGPHHVWLPDFVNFRSQDFWNGCHLVIWHVTSTNCKIIKTPFWSANIGNWGKKKSIDIQLFGLFLSTQGVKWPEGHLEAKKAKARDERTPTGTTEGNLVGHRGMSTWIKQLNDS